MKKALVLTLAVVLALSIMIPVAAPAMAAKQACATLQDKTILYSPAHYLAGKPIPLGYDPYGYNYQAHMFDGSYVNAYLGGYGFPPYTGNDESYLAANPSAAALWCWPYRNDRVAMKWNDEWLSNKDCDGDGKLDRHYGYASYIGSGAWETNHQSGTYDTCKWNYFCKIVAVPSDAVNNADIWYTAGGSEIGPAIWGEFATIQEVYNDPCAGYKGILYKSPTSTGLGFYGPQTP